MYISIVLVQLFQIDPQPVSPIPLLTQEDGGRNLMILSVGLCDNLNPSEFFSVLRNYQSLLLRKDIPHPQKISGQH